jgi:hypothetical protein
MEARQALRETLDMMLKREEIKGLEKWIQIVQFHQGI